MASVRTVKKQVEIGHGWMAVEYGFVDGASIALVTLQPMESYKSSGPVRSRFDMDKRVFLDGEARELFDRRELDFLSKLLRFLSDPQPSAAVAPPPPPLEV